MLSQVCALRNARKSSVVNDNNNSNVMLKILVLTFWNSINYSKFVICYRIPN